jgi:hypothetical protein
MAWTTTKVDQHNEGNRVCQTWLLQGDSATLELSTGLANVLVAYGSPRSCTTASFKVKGNQLTAATASQGTVALTGCTAGDDIYLTVMGN